jgi:CBS domain-containing protein
MGMKKRPLLDPSALRKLRDEQSALKGVEAFPYGEELSSVMVAPAFTCEPGRSVKDVVHEMSERGVSSVVVVDDSGEPLGILTERDVLKRIVAADNPDATASAVSEVMTPEPVTLSVDDSIYSALSVLTRMGVKHLPIVDEGKAVGMVTMRQLLRLRHPEPTTLIGSIHEAENPADLKAVLTRMPGLAAAKLGMGIAASEVSAMLSLINRDIHERVFELAIEKVGEPPVEVCLFLTGSHGRMENLLVTDQDHGMIIAGDENKHETYFMDLARTFSETLVDIGYAWCPGYIMSANPTWRKSLGEWKVQLDYWFERQVSGLARYVTVFFDAEPIWGDTKLFDDLSTYAHRLLGTHHEVLRVLHEEEGRHKVPTGFMGRFITEKGGEHKGELNVKRSGLIFVVEAVRILALMRSIRETSTLKRIAALVEGGFIHDDDGEYFEAAFKSLIHFALASEVEKSLAGKKPDTFINPGDLSTREKELLRHAYKAVSTLQGLVASEFGELVI